MVMRIIELCHAFYILLTKEIHCKKTDCYIMYGQLKQGQISTILYLDILGYALDLDICIQFAWDIFYFSDQSRWKLFFISKGVNISVKPHIYDFCWLNYFPSPVFAACARNWIIAFETWCSAATVSPNQFYFKDLATLSYSNMCIITFYCWPWMNGQVKHSRGKYNALGLV